MMKRPAILIGIMLILLSAFPIFLIAREIVTQKQLDARYEISHSYINSYGSPSTIDTQEVVVLNQFIEIEEISTGKIAPQTIHDLDEGVAGGDIVQIQWRVNGEEVSTADEIWLSNRDRGSRYYSWIDVLKVKDLQKNSESVVLIQRLTADDERMEDRVWKLIQIDESGEVSEERFTYQNRHEHLLGVRLINYSGTTLMSTGYYSDLLHYYPSIYYPILYPFGTVIMGVLLVIFGCKRRLSPSGY